MRLVAVVTKYRGSRPGVEAITSGNPSICLFAALDGAEFVPVCQLRTPLPWPGQARQDRG
jgi:hypothetical protein